METSNTMMMGSKVRGVLAGGIAAVAVMAAAGPALAKCGPVGMPCPDPVKIEVTVDRPEMGAPIVIRGRDAWRMLYVTGVNSRAGGTGDDDPPPQLGPHFDVIYRFTSGADSRLVYQDLYPYAPDRPFAFTPPGQRFMDRYAEIVEAADGWRGSRTLEMILRAHGLPAAAPPGGTSTSAAGVVGLPGDDEAGGPPSWAWLAVAAGVLGLGGLAARRRFRRRSAAPA